MYHVAVDILESCCPWAAAVLEEAEPDAPTYLDFPPSHWKRLHTSNVQERTNREIERRSRGVQVVPLGQVARAPRGRRHMRAGRDTAGMRYFSEAKMDELYDDKRAHEIDGPVDWMQLEANARKTIESNLELADRVEAA